MNKIEFREQPGGSFWEANQRINGVLFKWSIVNPKKRYFDVELWADDQWIGFEEATTFKKAVTAAGQLKKDYYNQEEE